MRVICFLCTETLIIDQQSNNVSAINLLEELNAPAFPIIISSLSVLATLAREGQEADEVQVVLRMTLGQQVLFEQNIVMNYQGRPRTRSVTRVQGVVLQTPGELKVEGLVAGECVGEWVIQVKQVGLPEGQTVVTSLQ